MIESSYSNTRANLASLLDKATLENEIIVIQRRGKEPVAMISLSELEGLSETAHLLRSPKNATRLLKALSRAKSQEGKNQSLSDLEKEYKLNEKNTKRSRIPKRVSRRSKVLD